MNLLKGSIRVSRVAQNEYDVKNITNVSGGQNGASSAGIFVEFAIKQAQILKMEVF